jgi:3-dehydroquinate synthase
MLVAGEISKNLGIFAVDELESLRQAVRACGSLPRADDLEVEKLMRSMSGDKKSVAGQIKWVLLERIGKARIVNQKEIDTPTLKQSLRAGLRSLN